MIPAATVRKRGVEPQLDVIAMGHHEGLIFYNPTPEVDSLFELLPRVVDRRDGSDGRRFARMLVQAKVLNGDQTDRAKDVCGWLDTLAVDLADAEINNPVRRAIGSRAIARSVRPHLKLIAAADRVDSTVLRAVRDVARLVAGIPRQQVLSPAVKHELGVALYPLLADIVGEAAQR